MPTNAPQLSPAAKAKVAAVASLAMAGITAWQIVTRNGFSWWDIVPVAAAVLGAATTDHVENTLTRPASKAVVHGALSLLAAITAALAAVIGPEPSGVSAAKVAVAVLGTLALWYIPEAGPDVKVIEGEVAAGAPAAKVLATVAEDAGWMARPDLPPAHGPVTQPMPAVTADPAPDSVSLQPAPAASAPAA